MFVCLLPCCYAWAVNYIVNSLAIYIFINLYCEKHAPGVCDLRQMSRSHVASLDVRSMCVHVYVCVPVCVRVHDCKQAHCITNTKPRWPWTVLYQNKGFPLPSPAILWSNGMHTSVSNSPLCSETSFMVISSILETVWGLPNSAINRN